MNIFSGDEIIDSGMLKLWGMILSELRLWGSQMSMKRQTEQTARSHRTEKGMFVTSWRTGLTLSRVRIRGAFVCLRVYKAEQSESLVKSSHAGSLAAALIMGWNPCTKLYVNQIYLTIILLW